MGCCATQHFRPEFEVNSIENKLEIKSVTSDKIDKVVHRYSTKGKVSSLQFESICRTLQLNKESSSCAYLKMFYREDEDTYDARELSSVGILHC